MTTIRGTGPFYVSQSWGAVPGGLVGATTSAARAKASLRRFARAQREDGSLAASRYRILRCVDRTAAERAMAAAIGSTPAGCEHVVEGDL